MKVNVKAMADAILDKVKAEHVSKALMVISVGENEASQSYIRSKERACEYCGIPFKHIHMDESLASNADVLCCIHNANEDNDVGGIILQLPLPAGFDENIAQAIRPKKDVDGLVKHSKFNPCTPEGVIYIMKQYFGSDLTGKEVLIIGRGKLVGEPLRKMLDKENCTVAVKHSKSNPDFGTVGQFGTVHWDCIVSATPVINSECDFDYDAGLWIDCGIGRGVDGRLHGNLMHDDACEMAYTPVPGGVGLMTVAMLMAHMAKTMNKDFEVK